LYEKRLKEYGLLVNIDDHEDVNDSADVVIEAEGRSN
jgi:hypothetical protein